MMGVVQGAERVREGTRRVHRDMSLGWLVGMLRLDLIVGWWLLRWEGWRAVTRLGPGRLGLPRLGDGRRRGKGVRDLPRDRASRSR